jgi:outer membrane autotransporter protein
MVNPGNSPSTLTVGTYTSNPGAIQVVEMASASNYDKIVTTGAGGATLIGGTLSPQLLDAYFPSTNTVFHVVEATGGGAVTGTFAGIDNPRVGASRTLFWQAQYTPTTADLKAVGNYTPPGMALTANQRSVGSALNSLAPGATGGDLLTVLDAINALTSDAGVAAAYTEISPAKYAALPSLAFPVTHMQFQYLQNRLARVRWEVAPGNEAVRTSRRGFGRGFSFSYDSDNRLLLAASNMTISDAGARYLNTGIEQCWGIYLEPNANWGSQSATANLAGYRYKNFGFTLGAEYWLLDNLLVGLNTGYSRTLGSTGGSGGDLNANIIPVNAYGAFFHRGFYANLAVGYTYSSYDMQRTIAFGAINRTAQANTSGNQFQLGAETGYDAKIGNAVVGPVLSLQYATQTVAGFTESNAGALALHVSSQTADSLQSGLGVRASYNARLGNVEVRPHLSVTWQHEFSDNTRGLNASLAAGGSTINFQTDRLGQDFALISLDIPAKITRNLVANLGYTAEVGRNRSSNMGANIGLKLKW